MPTRTYMVIDPRHDHSFRIPRPDLSVKLGTPNACNNCHKDKSAEWAAADHRDLVWARPEGFQKYAEAFHATWSDQPDAAKLLAAVAADRDTPAFARASALTDLAPASHPRTAIWRGKDCRTPTPWYGSARSTCSKMFRPARFGRLFRRFSPIPAAASASGLRRCLPWYRPRTSQPPTAKSSRARRPNSSMRNASMRIVRNRARRSEAFFAKRGRSADAEAEYKAALRLSPQYVPAAINLSDLYRSLGRDGDSEKLLRAAIVAAPPDAGASLFARPGSRAAQASR